MRDVLDVSSTMCGVLALGGCVSMCGLVGRVRVGRRGRVSKNTVTVTGRVWRRGRGSKDTVTVTVTGRVSAHVWQRTAGVAHRSN